MWISKKKYQNFEERIAALEHSQKQQSLKVEIDTDNLMEVLSQATRDKCARYQA